MVLSTPTFPLVTPPMDRKSRACQNDVEKAKPMQDSTVRENISSETDSQARVTEDKGLTGTPKPDHQDSLAAEQARVGDSPPHHSGEELGGREARAGRDLHEPRSVQNSERGMDHSYCRIPAWVEMTESDRLGLNHLSW